MLPPQTMYGLCLNLRICWFSSLTLSLSRLTSLFDLNCQIYIPSSSIVSTNWSHETVSLFAGKNVLCTPLFRCYTSFSGIFRAWWRQVNGNIFELCWKSNVDVLWAASSYCMENRFEEFNVEFLGYIKFVDEDGFWSRRETQPVPWRPCRI